MMDLKKIGESAMRRGMQLMGDPRVMKVMSDPRVMKVVMQAFQLRGTVQSIVDGGVKEIAHRLHLATREEVAELHATLRDVEAALHDVQTRVEIGGFEPDRPVEMD